MLRRLCLALLAVLALAGTAACSARSGAGGGTDDSNQRYVAGDGRIETVPVSERKPAPVLRGTALDGTKLSTAQYRGRVVVVNFWASWCSPCRSEAPALRDVQKHTRTDGVRFLGVNFKDDKANAQVFERQFRPGYPSLYDQPGETALAFRGQLPPQAVPSTIVVDRQGRVAARVIGEASYTRLLAVVRAVAR